MQEPRPETTGEHADDSAVLREVLGYLNFSSGSPDSNFRRNLNELALRWTADDPRGFSHVRLAQALATELERVADEPAFSDSTQARQAIEIAFEELPLKYREFHRDLLGHLDAEAFENPMLLARFAEAVLSQGPPFSDRQSTIEGALESVNNFLGIRPLAVLENDRQMQAYPHERYCPPPIYIRDVAPIAGPYRRLLERTLAILEHVPDEQLRAAQFDPHHLDEIALDHRPHDHVHPVNKRTNYMFGEWDPHTIDNSGNYRRFVLRKVILDALVEWMHDQEELSEDEAMGDAATVLCGTFLMASAISGSGPGAYTSEMSLTTLLPEVARLRDEYYAARIQNETGPRAERLHASAELHQQPFGHVRQALNLSLAKLGAWQVQLREVALLFARLGYAEPSRERAREIAALSVRFESEIQLQLTLARLAIDRRDVRATLDRLIEIEDLQQRGIHCGALIDPWNILGFAGNFPLFHAPEDTVFDHRAEVLIDFQQQIFDAYAEALREAVLAGEGALAEEITSRFRRLTTEWDRYATGTVADLPVVKGEECFASAQQVAETLERWKRAGDATGVAFWREEVERLNSAGSLGAVAEALLKRDDLPAAMGLLMQWLDLSDEVGLEANSVSIESLLVEWMSRSAADADAPDQFDEFATRTRRFFDYLEANGERWHRVTTLKDVTGTIEQPVSEDSSGEWDAQFDDEDDDSDLFGAAYDQMIFRDSADDGNEGETLDAGPLGGQDYEIDGIAGGLEPRMRFLHALAGLWQQAAGKLAELSADEPEIDVDLRDWLAARAAQIHQWQRQLNSLLAELNEYEIDTPYGDHDANVEYDMQLQRKFGLLQMVINTQLAFRAAERFLRCVLPPEEADGKTSKDLAKSISVIRPVLTGDADQLLEALPEFLAFCVKRPLLYRPLEAGGDPQRIAAVRNIQELLRFLCEQLPAMGRIEETWRVLVTAYRMERVNRPGGVAVTEFDRLFRTGLRCSLEALVASHRTWDAEDAEKSLLELVEDLVSNYAKLWQKHSRQMRLSAVEAIAFTPTWERTREFIERYGNDLFHARMLTLGNMRAILHNGVGDFLEYLEESSDPVEPIALLADLDAENISIEGATENLESIYQVLVDCFDRFLEYNTTTTQSDYGEKIFCLFEFLRVESEYDRDAWLLIPFSLAHEVLARGGLSDCAFAWEELIKDRSREKAQRHLDRLAGLEREFGMQLPSLRDHICERFLSPLAVNRMRALIAPALKETDSDQQSGFARLKAEIDAYLETSVGSAIDVPDWLRLLQQEVETSLEEQSEPGDDYIATPISIVDARKQVTAITERILKRSKQAE